MKTAIYIEDGVVQLVLTPEGEFEKNAIASIAKKTLSLKVFDGTFYDCRGGWTRQSSYFPHHNHFNSGDYSANSLILRVEEEKPTP